MIREEFNRLLFEADESDGYAGMELMEVEVGCDGDAWDVYLRTKEALAVILSQELLNEVIEHEWDDYGSDEQDEKLGPWFRKNVMIHAKGECLSESTEYLEWFNDGRDWFWWNARVRNDDLLHVYIKLSGFPVSGFDALRWLLKCCGATSVEQGDLKDIAELYE